MKYYAQYNGKSFYLTSTIYHIHIGLWCVYTVKSERQYFCEGFLGCMKCKKIILTQECIPVGCVLLALYRTGGVSVWGVSLTETPLYRDPLGQEVTLYSDPPSPVNRMTHRCNNLTPDFVLWAVTSGIEYRSLRSDSHFPTIAPQRYHKGFNYPMMHHLFRLIR